MNTQIEDLVNRLTAEVSNQNLPFNKIKEPKAELKISYQEHLDHIGSLRGRPLHYPYIGTGRGHGPFVELADGSVKLDLINGIGINLMGHANPRVMKAAIQGALSDVIMQGNLEPNMDYVQFSELLVKIASRKSRLKHVWFASCGTIANENALKMSRQKNSPARMIVTFQNAFAGRSTMMAEVTDNPSFKQGLPEYNEVLRLPFYNKKDPQSTDSTLRALKEHVAKHEKNISCFVFEPMLGEGGYNPAPREFFIPLLEFCKQNHIAVWADEIQTFCRTGEYFAFETLDFGQYVDLCTVAKTAQLGATLYTEEYNPKPGLIAGTFAGSTVSMKTGMEMIQMLQEGFLGPQGRIQQIHKKFVEGLNRLNETTCKGLVQDAGGMGLMIAFTPFDGDKDRVNNFLKKLFTNGIVGFSCGKIPLRCRFLVPAIIKDHEIETALSVVEKTILEGV
ncbi:MAG TPA: aminotransferase class III-fold pyridoxal phosphate-dependent enzyme [Pseudobdellovibrionaceae bacterium]|nr:aminotransferase class III-fold pyridoxal phosphate-dependent enzyme [Pseudobdellovibrionaceae bacterium]